MANILVLGASGQTGRLVVNEALAGQHRVTAFVRNPEKLTRRDPNLSVVQGDFTRTAEIAKALDGQDAVISALGFPTPSSRSPELVAAFAAFVDLMEQRRVGRLIYLSSLGVPGGTAPLSWFVRIFVVKTFLRNVLADHAENEKVIRASSLDWTIVRPPRLTNGPKNGVYRQGVDIHTGKLVASISRADVAAFIVSLLADQRYARQAATITD